MDKSGNADWVRPFTQMSHIGGFTSAQGLCIVGDATMCDFHVLNADGLGLPGFSSPSAWLDHVQAADAFLDKDGNINVIVTDCTKSCNDWYRLEQVRHPRRREPADGEAGDGRAAGRASGHAAGFCRRQTAGDYPPVPHLKAPLTMDGDLQKWRAAGITPQLILTPEIGGYRIAGGVRDAAARFSASPGKANNLYMQAFKFDDAGDNPQSTRYAPICRTPSKWPSTAPSKG